MSSFSICTRSTLEISWIPISKVELLHMPCCEILCDSNETTTASKLGSGERLSIYTSQALA